MYFRPHVKFKAMPRETPGHEQDRHFVINNGEASDYIIVFPSKKKVFSRIHKYQSLLKQPVHS